MSEDLKDFQVRTFRRIHMSHSITGPLKNWNRSDWVRATKYILKNDGSKFSVDELKDHFLSELAKGHEKFPMGDCDNFDWKKGCLGHPMKEGEAQ